MSSIKIFFCLLIVSLFSNSIFAQKVVLKGHIIDSAINVRLEGVSVSTYLGDSDKIYQLQVSKRFGSFIFDNMLADTSITIKLDYLGYQRWSKKIRISKSKSELDLGFIHMTPLVNEIEAVEMLPPVRMNGDTVEFNTDAFQLDTNAVIEDLFHKLPGMVIWGDGKITYNGKTIRSFKVDGKEFFGTDYKVMAQNLPKNAVDKVQVYKTSPDNKDEPDKDSDYEMNLQLKDNAKKGYFGSVSVNGGTEKRYNVLGVINTYTPKFQGSAGFAKNNTNLNINNVETLLKGTTFGGVNANSEFYSDFFKSGITNRMLYGGRFQYDLNNKSPNEYSNLLRLDIHRDDAERTSIDSSETVYFTGDIDRESQKKNTRVDHTKLFTISPKYDYQNEKIIISGNINWNNNQSNNESKNSTIDNYENVSTLSRTESFEESKGSNFTSGFSLSNKPNYNLQKQKLFDKLRYRINYNGDLSNNNSTNISRRYTESSEGNLPYDANVSREYSSDSRQNTNSFGLVFEDLNKFIRKNILSRITLSNYYQQNQNINDILVEDIVFNNGKPSTVINNELSHESVFKSKHFSSHIELGKNIILAHHATRFQKDLIFTASLKANGLQWGNESTLDFRNINRNFFSLFPSAAISYRHQKGNTTDIVYKIAAESSENYPTLHQLAPIYDNIDAFYRFYGGAGLRREKVNKIKADFNFLEKKADGYDLNVNYTFTDLRDPIVDSIIYNPNYQESYLVNSSRNTHNHSLNMRLSKYFLLNRLNRLSIEGSFGGLNGKNERFVNTISQMTRRNSYNQNITLTYFYSDKIQIAYNNLFNAFSTYQLESTNKHNTSQLRHNLSLTTVLASKFYINTNLNSQTFYAKGLDRESLFIWNASARYRMLKGNNLEIKLTALDILGQNKGIYVINNENQQSYGIRNILTQYFMLGVTYYPRKFNLNK